MLPTHRVILDGAAGDAAPRPRPTDSSRFVAWPSADELLDAMRADGGGPIRAGDRLRARDVSASGAAAAERSCARGATRSSRWSTSTISEAARWLDVNLLAIALERAARHRRDRTGRRRALTYTQDAAEAIARVDRGEGVSAFLLDPTPVAAVTQVAAAGDVMPQKSTYFHPKAPTGICFAPLEW